MTLDMMAMAWVMVEAAVAAGSWNELIAATVWGGRANAAREVSSAAMAVVAMAAAVRRCGGAA